MKPGDLAAALRRRMWLLLALIVLAGGLAFTVGKIQSPVYKAQATLAGTAVKDPITNLPDPNFVYGLQTSMTSVTNAAVSREIAQAVSDRLAETGVTLTADELLRKVAGTTVPGSTAMQISASDADPERAATIANLWGQEASKRLSRTPLLLGGDLQFTNEAVPPTSPVQPKPLVYGGLGLFLGLVIGLTFVVADEYYHPHFRSAKQAEDVLGIKVAGIIPRLEKKVSASTPLAKIPEESTMHDSYNEIRTVLLAAAKRYGPTSVTVTDIGAQNPVLCLNLAVSIAGAGRRVLLLDCDLRDKSMTRLLHLDSRDGVAETLHGLTEMVPVIGTTDTENIFVIATGRTSEDPADLFARPAFDAFLAELKTFFDVILINAPSLSSGPGAAIIAAKTDESLVVIDAERCTHGVAAAALEDLERCEVKPEGLILANLRLPKGFRKHRKVMGEGSLEGTTGMHWEVLSSSDIKIPIAAFGGTLAIDSATPDAPTGETGHVSPEEAEGMGVKGEPIPPAWIDSLRAPGTRERLEAEQAIHAYYRGLLSRSGVDAETVAKVSVAIVGFLKREGPYGAMDKTEMETVVQEMIAKAASRHVSARAARPGGSKAETGATVSGPPS